MFLAATNIELWRIQLFGRWGSQIFLQHIKDAPLAQLDQLSMETSVHISMATAKAQLQDLLRQAKSDITSTLACPTPLMLQDCEAATPADIEPPKASDPVIRNCNGGKLHRTLGYEEQTHPKHWRTRCSWHFGLSHTSFEVVDDGYELDHKCCLKCFPSSSEQSSSSSSSSSEPTA